MRPKFSSLSAALLALSIPVLAVVGCGTAAAHPTNYQPQVRNFVITTEPIAVHEMQGSMDYLQKDFAKGGVLDGKEAYGFYPSTIVVYQGDTLNLTLVNPQDDAHTFTIGDLQVNAAMPGESSTALKLTASKPGIYTFQCEMPEHAPYMWGELVVLPDSSAS